MKDMENTKGKPTKTENGFNPKDASLAFLSFTFICIAVMLILTIYDVLTMQNILSFDKPAKLIMNIMMLHLLSFVWHRFITLHPIKIH